MKKKQMFVLVASAVLLLTACGKTVKISPEAEETAQAVSKGLLGSVAGDVVRSMVFYNAAPLMSEKLLAVKELIPAGTKIELPFVVTIQYADRPDCALRRILTAEKMKIIWKSPRG